MTTQTFNKVEDGIDLSVTVLGSSSSGNGYIFGRLILEAGLPFSKYEPYMHMCDTLFISHRHGDHCNVQTIKKMRAWKEEREQEFAIVCNEDVADFLAGHSIIIDVNTVDTFTMQTATEGRLFMLTEAKHSVKTSGLFGIIETDKSIKVFEFITDSRKIPSTIELPAGTMGRDVLIGESNYKREIVEANKAAAKQTGAWFNDHTYNHMDMQTMDEHILYMCKENALIIEAHQSSSNRPQNKGLIITKEQVRRRNG